MNTIEYRVDCQLLQYLHWENALGCRFPIGKTDQVRAALRCALLCCVALRCAVLRHATLLLQMLLLPVGLEQGKAAKQQQPSCPARSPPRSTACTPNRPPSPLALPPPPQVEQWQREEIMGFWGRHYFPANATLYVVGDIDVQASCDS